MIEVFGIFFTFVVIFFIAAVFIYVLKSGNKANEKQKNTQQLESSKKMGNLAAPAQYAVKKNQNLQNNQQTSGKHAIIQPSLRDHLHGTTTQTSIENCKKNHFLNKNENFTTQSDIKCSIIVDEEDLEKLIVIGEAINNPAYKRKRR